MAIVATSFALVDPREWLEVLGAVGSVIAGIIGCLAVAVSILFVITRFAGDAAESPISPDPSEDNQQRRH